MKSYCSRKVSRARLERRGIWHGKPKAAWIWFKWWLCREQQRLKVPATKRQACSFRSGSDQWKQRYLTGYELNSDSRMGKNNPSCSFGLYNIARVQHASEHMFWELKLNKNEWLCCLPGSRAHRWMKHRTYDLQMWTLEQENSELNLISHTVAPFWTASAACVLSPEVSVDTSRARLFCRNFSCLRKKIGLDL